MHFGLRLNSLNQKIRSQERLGFYAQYGAQFAHEIRNGLYLHRQILREVSEGRAAGLRMEDMRAALQRLDFLDRLCIHFNKVGALYRQPVGPRRLNEDLAGIVRSAAAAYSDHARIQLRLSLQTSPTLCIRANPELLEAALMNLIKNGVEAIGTQTLGLIEVTAEECMEKVRIRIQDNGPGLPPERLEDPFQPRPSRKADGFGIGLAVARNCIEAMGGTIGLRTSEPGQTCFEIAFDRCGA